MNAGLAIFAYVAVGLVAAAIFLRWIGEEPPTNTDERLGLAGVTVAAVALWPLILVAVVLNGLGAAVGRWLL